MIEGDNPRRQRTVVLSLEKMNARDETDNSVAFVSVIYLIHSKYSIKQTSGPGKTQSYLFMSVSGSVVLSCLINFLEVSLQHVTFFERFR